MGKKGEKWGISQSVYPIPHKINSPFFPIFPHFSPFFPIGSPPRDIYFPSPPTSAPLADIAASKIENFACIFCQQELCKTFKNVRYLFESVSVRFLLLIFSEDFIGNNVLLAQRVYVSNCTYVEGCIWGIVHYFGGHYVGGHYVGGHYGGGHCGGRH